MILISILVLSIIINILLFWYARKLLQKLAFFSEDIIDINEDLEIFAEHLVGLHAQETYYGDVTLQKLIEHSKTIVEDVQQFKDLYLIGEVNQGPENYAEEEEQEIE